MVMVGVGRSPIRRTTSVSLSLLHFNSKRNSIIVIMIIIMIIIIA